MNQAIVYISAAAFMLYIFPVHVFSYVYMSTRDNCLSVNVSLFRLIPLFNFNTKRQSNDENDREGEKGGAKLKYPSHYLDLYNKLCLTKIVQVADFGIQNNQGNVYALLAQHAATQALYSFVKINGGKTKLRNFVVLNGGHGYIEYYLKLVGVINLAILLRLFIIYLWSKLNER